MNRIRTLRDVLVAACLITTSTTDLSAQLNTAWTTLNPAAPPSARAGHAMANDQDQCWLFGGLGASALNDLWRFNGFNWSQVTTAGTPPSPRFGHAMAFDSTRNRLVLFGGTSLGSTLDDTWAFSISNSTWTQLTPATAPFPRSGHAMAYDSARDRVVVFGGAFNSNSVLEFDGTNWQSFPLLTAPLGRRNGRMAFDSIRNVCVLFGGSNSNSTVFYGDTWEWNGTAWSNPTNAGPSARALHSMVFDPIRGRTIVIGGINGMVTPGQTWEWDGAAWVLASTATAPATQYDHAAAVDLIRHRTVLFGGQAGATTSQATSGYDSVVDTQFFLSLGSCSGSNGDLTMTVRRFAWMGDLFSVDVGNLVPGNAVVMHIDLQTWSSPPMFRQVLDLTPLGATGCTLFTVGDLVATMPAAGMGGVSSMAFPIGNDAFWLGRELVMQAITLDPPANALGIVPSRAFLARIGQR